MARNMQPIAKRCKALGISPAVMGYKNKETIRNPKGQMRRKKSERTGFFIYFIIDFVNLFIFTKFPSIW